MWQNPPVGDHRGVVRVHGGGTTWNVPVSLRVHSPDSVVMQRLLMPLSNIAMLCFSVGIIAMLLTSIGVTVISSDVAWQMIVVGLVSRVLLRLVRAGTGR
jgi:hypothetical protein